MSRQINLSSRVILLNLYHNRRISKARIREVCKYNYLQPQKITLYGKLKFAKISKRTFRFSQYCWVPKYHYFTVVQCHLGWCKDIFLILIFDILTGTDDLLNYRQLYSMNKTRKKLCFYL